MSKKSRSEGNRVAMAIKANKSSYYISDVDLEDNYEDVLAAATSVRKILKELPSGFLLISAGIVRITVIVDTKNKDLSAKEWLTAAMSEITYQIDGDDDYAKTTIEIDTPFKLKDIVRGQAFAFLRKNGELEEESEDEEYYEF